MPLNPFLYFYPAIAVIILLFSPSDTKEQYDLTNLIIMTYPFLVVVVGLVSRSYSIQLIVPQLTLNLILLYLTSPFIIYVASGTPSVSYIFLIIFIVLFYSLRHHWQLLIYTAITNLLSIVIVIIYPSLAPLLLFVFLGLCALWHHYFGATFIQLLSRIHWIFRILLSLALSLVLLINYLLPYGFYITIGYISALYFG